MPTAGANHLDAYRSVRSERRLLRAPTTCTRGPTGGADEEMSFQGVSTCGQHRTSRTGGRGRRACEDFNALPTVGFNHDGIGYDRSREAQHLLRGKRLGRRWWRRIHPRQQRSGATHRCGQVSYYRNGSFSLAHASRTLRVLDWIQSLVRRCAVPPHDQRRRHVAKNTRQRLVHRR